MKNIAILLVGGSGSRLWPLSRKYHPKQFVRFENGQSLFQLTVKRLLNIWDAQDIITVSGHSYRFIIKNQIDLIEELSTQQKNQLKSNIILEPCPRNTLPAVLLALKKLEKRKKCDNQTLTSVFPSDHFIEPVLDFVESVNMGLSQAAKGRIMIFGIKPSGPNTGFGYILPRGNGEGSNSIKAFVEKPSKSEAQKLIESGALWNAGIFTFRKDVFLRELALYAPKQWELYGQSLGDFTLNFGQCPNESVDFALLQKTKEIGVIPFKPQWSDLGSWDSLLTFFAEKKKNFSFGQSLLLDSQNCLTYSQDRLIAGIGLEDLIVVDGQDSVMIIKKGDSDRVREIVAEMEKKGSAQVDYSPTVHRPWGYYTVLFERKGYKVKEIGVYPGCSLSLQKHKFRSEHWNIVEGKARIIIGDDILIRKANQSVFVPKNIKHKLSNPHKGTLRIIEVQIGDYLGEDDIVRYEEYKD